MRGRNVPIDGATAPLPDNTSYVMAVDIMPIPRQAESVQRTTKY